MTAASGEGQMFIRIDWQVSMVSYGLDVRRSLPLILVGWKSAHNAPGSTRKPSPLCRHDRFHLILRLPLF